MLVTTQDQAYGFELTQGQAPFDRFYFVPLPKSNHDQLVHHLKSSEQILVDWQNNLQTRIGKSKLSLITPIKDQLTIQPQDNQFQTNLYQLSKITNELKKTKTDPYFKKEKVTAKDIQTYLQILTQHKVATELKQQLKQAQIQPKELHKLQEILNITEKLEQLCAKTPSHSELESLRKNLLQNKQFLDSLSEPQNSSTPLAPETFQEIFSLLSSVELEERLSQFLTERFKNFAQDCRNLFSHSQEWFDEEAHQFQPFLQDLRLYKGALEAELSLSEKKTQKDPLFGIKKKHHKKLQDQQQQLNQLLDISRGIEFDIDALLQGHDKHKNTLATLKHELNRLFLDNKQNLKQTRRKLVNKLAQNGLPHDLQLKGLTPIHVRDQCKAIYQELVDINKKILDQYEVNYDKIKDLVVEYAKLSNKSTMSPSSSRAVLQEAKNIIRYKSERIRLINKLKGESLAKETLAKMLREAQRKVAQLGTQLPLHLRDLEIGGFEAHFRLSQQVIALEKMQSDLAKRVHLELDFSHSEAHTVQIFFLDHHTKWDQTLRLKLLNHMKSTPQQAMTLLLSHDIELIQLLTHSSLGQAKLVREPVPPQTPIHQAQLQNQNLPNAAKPKIVPSKSRQIEQVLSILNGHTKSPFGSPNSF